MTDSLRWKLERSEAEVEQLRTERAEALLRVKRLQDQHQAVLEALGISECCCYIGPDEDGER